jgi:hypothetical protein
MKRTLLVALGLMLPATIVVARQQQQDRTGFVVTQLQICAPENQAAIDRFNDGVMAPIMEELKAEGMIRSWAHLVHSWGDEWNNVNITVVDNHATWVSAWAEVMRRLNVRSPTWIEEVLPLCSLHKDNMYSMRNSR